MKVDGVLKPNLVICSTGHVAALKACNYLNIETRIVPYDSNCQMHISKMKSSID
jgi:glutamate/tyrosine decarboxylase-like PLP-dependent enzyme